MSLAAPLSAVATETVSMSHWIPMSGSRRWTARVPVRCFPRPETSRCVAIREDFAAETEHGGHDGSDGRALRYLDWTFDPDPSDNTYLTDYAYLLHAEGLLV